MQLTWVSEKNLHPFLQARESPTRSASLCSKDGALGLGLFRGWCSKLPKVNGEVCQKPKTHSYS